MPYAEVAIHRSIHQSFTYHLPDSLAEQARPGQLVEVPFRAGQEAAIIIALSDDPPPFATKSVLAILDEQPVLTPQQLALARWLAEQTAAPIGDCVWLMLPPGFSPRRDTRYHLLGGTLAGQTPDENLILSYLARRGPLTGRQLGQIMPKARWSKAARALVEGGLIRAEAILAPPSVQAKQIRTASLAMSPSELGGAWLQVGRESRRGSVLETLRLQAGGRMPLEALLAATGVNVSVVRKLRQETMLELEADKTVVLTLDEAATRAAIIALRGGEPYLAILELLAERGPLSLGEIYEQTPAKSEHLNKLEAAGYVQFGESEVLRNSLARKTYQPTSPPPRTAEQAAIWQGLRASLETPRGEAFLIRGVTGSGKTEVYMQAVAHVLAQGRSAIVLVPEIALTAQMVQRFVGRFGQKVALIHSSLSAGERYDTWRRARAGEVQVIIGARSALFSPLPNLGLIVLDEEHDPSYKQSPPISPPYYQARETALEYVRLLGGTLILGSATPDVVSYYRAQTGAYTLLELPNRVLAHREQVAALQAEYQLEHSPYTPIEGTESASLALPPVQVVDMRQELRAGNTSIFSRSLSAALGEVLARQEQAILFLNRRGSASFVFCRDCGYIAKCPRCDSPLTYHKSQTALRCHGCGHKVPSPTTCPECQSKRIKFMGQGTELIEKALGELFPAARLLRWDQDTAANHHEHERIFQAFLQHEADFLVGTQMIAKGLDLPKVTLVGIISADTALGLPDYRAGEVSFQLLTQVAGRAGRSPLGGGVILQTYQPEHYAIQAAAAHDYLGFYQQEIAYREQLRWPPFRRLARLLIEDPDPQKAENEARRLAKLLTERLGAGHFNLSDLVGPVPCFFGRRDNEYRWQVLLRSPDPARVLHGLDLGGGCILDLDPIDIL
jgi:primosomal protein N' (replication factor Y)